MRRHLLNELRPLYDSIDFVQEVLGFFLARLRCGTAPCEPGKVLGYLTEMAKNIVLNANHRHLQTAKHDLHRETHLEGLTRAEKEMLGADEPEAWELACWRDRTGAEE